MRELESSSEGLCEQVWAGGRVIRRVSWWPDPERLDPRRWAPEVRAERPRFAYLPFGAGPRMCMGSDFAFAESVLLLGTLAQQWRARLVPGHPVEVQTRFTLRPKHGLPMTVELSRARLD